MEAGTWGGVLGVILLLLSLSLYRQVFKYYFKKGKDKRQSSKAEEITQKTKDSDADSMLQSMFNTVKTALPRKVEDGVEWREQNLTPEFFEYVYYVNKAKNYKAIDFEKIKSNMINKRGKIKNIADLCEKSGRSVAFRYVCEATNSEHRIVIKASDFK